MRTDGKTQNGKHVGRLNESELEDLEKQHLRLTRALDEAGFPEPCLCVIASYRDGPPSVLVGGTTPSDVHATCVLYASLIHAACSGLETFITHEVKHGADPDKLISTTLLALQDAPLASSSLIFEGDDA